MGFLDRLLGREEPQQQYAPPAARPALAPASARSDDEIAVERYRYLLRTAPPETIEQVHEEAFTKLTPEQRQLLFRQLSENAPAGEQPRGDDPRSLAQSATRSELRQPGTLERSFDGGGAGAANGSNRGGMGFGGMVASSLLGTVAGYVIGSALVSAFLPPVDATADGGTDAGDTGDTANADGGDPGAGTDAAGDTSYADGGDWSGGGGDFGGGDFGGGFDF
jgi:hypothetical protein